MKARKKSCGNTDENVMCKKKDFNFLKKSCENEAKDANIHFHE